MQGAGQKKMINIFTQTLCNPVYYLVYNQRNPIVERDGGVEDLFKSAAKFMPTKKITSVKACMISTNQRTEKKC